MPYVFGIVAVLFMLAFMIARKKRYYGRIFNEKHYAEIARWASEVIGRHPVEKSSIDNGTVVLTSGGLVLAYTSNIAKGNRSLHFSVSEHGRYTTGAVGGRVLFLLIRLLHKNRCEANLFRANSTVHHAVFSMPADRTWEIEPVEVVVADMAAYQPLPIETVNIA